MPRPRWPVNRSLNLPSPLPSFPIPDTGIEIKRGRRHLDRIRLNLLTRYWWTTLDRFKSRFDFEGVGKPEGKPEGKKVWTFYNKGVMLQLTKYPKSKDGPRCWFNIDIQDPDEETQLAVLDEIKEAIQEDKPAKRAVSLAQIEFALDVFPENKKYHHHLTRVLAYRAVMKHSRTAAFGKIGTTYYQGNDGDVRNGSKGLRIYPKSESGESFARIELQTNRHFLRRKGFGIESLPITSDTIDAFEFFTFRNGLDGLSLEKLTEAVTRRHWSERKKRHSKMANKVRLCCVRGMILSSIGHSQFYHLELGEEIDSPVIEQISTFKHLKKKYGLTLRAERLFPLCA